MAKAKMRALPVKRMGPSLLLLASCTHTLLVHSVVEASNHTTTDTTTINVNTTDPSFTISTDSQQYERMVVCSLCVNPQHEPLDLMARFESGGQSITCGYAHSLGQMEIPQDNCTFLQGWGETLCRCGPSNTISNPQGEDNRCHLCEDGSILPNGFMAGSPQTTCAELQVRAIRDDAFMCPTYQATVGTYCGCHNPKATANMCRLCGAEQPLPDHLKVIQRHRKRCGELEFDASIPGANCRLFQKLYSDQCCYDGEREPMLHDSGALNQSPGQSSSVFTIAMAALFAAIFFA